MKLKLRDIFCLIVSIVLIFTALYVGKRLGYLEIKDHYKDQIYIKVQPEVITNLAITCQFTTIFEDDNGGLHTNVIEMPIQTTFDTNAAETKLEPVYLPVYYIAQMSTNIQVTIKALQPLSPKNP